MTTRLAVVLFAIGTAACEGDKSDDSSSSENGTSDGDPGDGGAGDDGSGDDGGSGDGGTDDGGTDDGGTGTDSHFTGEGDPPSGNTGIASGYPGDSSIDSDPSVLFFDDFEGYGGGGNVGSVWDDVYWNVEITQGSEGVFAGSHGLQFYLPHADDELSNGVGKYLADEQDVLFVRMYSKFDVSFDVYGSSHNGVDIQAHYMKDGNATPGVPADGYNKYLASFESWRGASDEANPGRLNVYVYHPEQRSQWGDHWFPTGEVLPYSHKEGDFGDEFVGREDIVVELGRWYEYEIMLKANTAGERDGRVILWLDGDVIADFQNLRFRDTDDLTKNRVGLSLHAGANEGPDTYKWYDNVVFATSYIGPIAE